MKLENSWRAIFWEGGGGVKLALVGHIQRDFLEITGCRGSPSNGKIGSIAAVALLKQRARQLLPTCQGTGPKSCKQKGERG